jgi:RNA polymerase sigma factor (sigma-70 family)
MADRYIINKCLNGDSTAFGMLVDKYKESVYALAYSKLRNFHDAEDVTQEAFMKAYQNLRTLRQWDDFHAWIYAITNNICKMMIRSRSRQPDREFIEDQTVKSLHIEESYHKDPMLELLHEALDSLPETYQQVLTLHYLGGMDGTEIAEFLGMSPTSIWQRLSRARSLLRKEMLDMMSETFEQNRLKAGFTFRIVEMVKGIRLNPISPKALPWGLSLATGIIIAVLSIGTHLNPMDKIGSMSGSPLPCESKVLKIGEIPVDVMKVSNISVLSNQRWKGNGLGSVVPSLQNALFMAPQAEGGTWTKKADMQTAKYGLGASAVNNKIYTIGGESWHPDLSYSAVDEYDPETDKWISKADMPAARSFLSSVVLNGKIYAIGGARPHNIGAPAVEEYDPEKNSWAKKSDMPTARLALSTCIVNGKIYAIGGTTELFGGPFLQSVEEYDPIKDIWTKKEDIPTARSGLATSVVNGKIYAIGGTNQRAGFNDCVGLSTVEEYDPAKDKWAKKSDMPTARWGLSTIVLNDKIYSISGANRWPATPTVEIYDPITDTWTKGTDIPTVRALFGASIVDGKIYVFGGFTGASEISTVEECDIGLSGESINFKGKLPTTWGDVKLARNK